MKKAFTLIELLVVIAIIAILAAILFPVFAQAKLAAKKTQALSNVKNQGLAVVMYGGDSDDVYPLVQRASSVAEDPGQHGIPWQNLVGPYVKNGDKNKSVTLGDNEVVGGIWNSPSFPNQKVPRQFGINMHLAGDPTPNSDFGAGSPYYSISQTAVNNVANKVLIAEKGYMGSASGNPPDTLDFQLAQIEAVEWAWADGNFDLRTPKRADNDTDNTSKPYPWSNGMPRFRYSGVCNMAFADGHAKGMKLGQFGGVGGWCKYWFAMPNGGPSWYPYSSGDFQNASTCTQYEN